MTGGPRHNPGEPAPWERMPADVDRRSLIECLLPEVDDPIFELAETVFLDEHEPVRVSGIDQILLALARSVVKSPSASEALVMVPRCSNRTALLLAICFQLLRKRERGLLRGPVVLVASDINMAMQLRALDVQNRRRMGLADGNPLSAQRLARAGGLDPVIGSARTPTNDALIYLNTRVGWPPLSSAAPLVILDATSITSPNGRDRALEWATSQGYAGLVVIGDLADSTLLPCMRGAGLVPLVFPVTTAEAKELNDLCGRNTPPASTLSSMPFLYQPQPTVRLWPAGDAVVNEAVDRAMAALSARPKGPMAVELDMPVRLLRNGVRLAADYEEYCRACVNNPRPGEGPKALRRMLERRTFQTQGTWRAWGSARWGWLKHGVQTLWEGLESSNPKVPVLWDVLDELSRTTTGGLLLRCHSAAAVEATRATLESQATAGGLKQEVWQNVSDRLTIAAFNARFPAASFDAQILTGAPPPWLFAVLLGAEASESHVVTYAAETELLRAQDRRWADEISGWRAATARFSGAAPSADAAPVGLEDATACAGKVTHLPAVPGMSLSEVLSQASSALDDSELDVAAAGASLARSAGASWTTCVPVQLEGGRVWYCRNDPDSPSPVLVISAGSDRTVPVTRLRPGDRIVIPAGDGLESVHARLLAASRSNVDVASLELILMLFRSAARSIITREGTKAAAYDAAARAGCSAAGQLAHWAEGTTIAPRDPHDVEAVFKAAGTPCPDIDLIYAVAVQLRNLSSALRRFAAAIGSGRGREAVDQLRALVGDAAEEILDEFEVAVVAAVGDAREVPPHLAGQVR